MYNHFFFILLKSQSLLYKHLGLGNNNGFWRSQGRTGAAKKLRTALQTLKHELYVGPNPYAPIHQKYWSKSSKLRRLNLHNKNGTFNFDLSYFQCQLRYRFTQYLILKVSLVVLRMQVVLWCDSTFISCYSFQKTAILLHKRGFVDSQMAATVCI